MASGKWPVASGQRQVPCLTDCWSVHSPALRTFEPRASASTRTSWSTSSRTQMSSSCVCCACSCPIRAQAQSPWSVTMIRQSMASKVRRAPSSMHACMHTYAHTCRRTYMQTRIHADAHACIRTCTHVCIRTQVRRAPLSPSSPPSRVILDQNYRSTSNIVGASSALVRHNVVRVGKRVGRPHVLICSPTSLPAHPLRCTPP